MDKAEQQSRMQSAIVHLEESLRTLRTGRAHAGLVESIVVEAYGNSMPLKGLAGVNVLDARTLTIEPWDKSLVAVIEKAIHESGQGLNPQQDGKTLRINVPQPTEETRLAMVKVMKKMVEETRIRIRRIRDEVKNDLITKERAKEISEDDRYRSQEQLEVSIKSFNSIIDEMSLKKENEIRKL